MIGAFRFQPFKLSLALLGLLFSSHCFSQSVGPLLFTRWNQGCNYNAQCPNDAAGPCARVYTGCGATGFAQILRYHAWPPVGTSSNTYSLPAYGSLSANFSVTNYPWLLMPNYLSGPSANVAQLMFHSGVALSMMYGPSGSGSYFSSQSYALKHYFRYALDMKNEMKFAYSDSAWKEMLKAEMLAFRPVSYYGTGPSGGHLWVVDGYRNSPSEQFHMNWGWGGLYDGWYDLLAMNPGGAHYTTSGMLRRIHPAAPVEGYPDTIFVSASAQTPYFEITSDSAWTTTSSQPWATPSVSAGTAGYFQHSLTIAANPLWSQRTATVTIQRGNLRDSIFVIQAALPPSLSVTPALVSIGFSSGSQLITVFSDSAWTTSTADSWLSIVSGSGSGNGSFTINYAANPGLNPRTGIVVATRNGLSRTVTINQNGSGNMWCTPIVLTAGVNTAGLSNVTLNTINRTSLANEGYVLTGDSTQLWQDSTYTICLTFVGTVDPAIWIDYNIDGDFLDPGETILSPTSPWFPSNNTTRCTTFTVPSTATEGRTRMRVYVSSYNPNLGPITGPCFTADRGGDAEDYTIIIKNPRHLNVTPSPLSFTFAGGTQNLAVDCDSVWNLISYPAWVNPLPLTGSGNGTVAVTVPANSSTIGLSGNMQFTRGGITRNVPVTQTGADTILNAMPDTVFFTSAASLNPVTVTSNVAWNVSGGATWFSINATSGNGNSLVDVTASQNLSFSRREDSIRFYSGTHQKWVHIIQDSTSAVMTVVPSPLHFPWEGGTDSVQVTTGAGWTAFINDPWVSISQNSGTGNARIYVSADTNFVTVAPKSTAGFRRHGPRKS